MLGLHLEQRCHSPDKMASSFNGPLLYSNIKKVLSNKAIKDASCEAFSSGRGGGISKVIKFATTLGVPCFRKVKYKGQEGRRVTQVAFAL